MLGKIFEMMKINEEQSKKAVEILLEAKVVVQYALVAAVLVYTTELLLLIN